MLNLANSAGYIPRNDLTAIAVALYGTVTIILWTRKFVSSSAPPVLYRLCSSCSYADFIRNGKHKWMLALTIGSTCQLCQSNAEKKETKFLLCRHDTRLLRSHRLPLHAILAWDIHRINSLHPPQCKLAYQTLKELTDENHLSQPCAFLAADYVALSRIANYLGPNDVSKHCLIFPASAIVKFFVISDITTFLIQAAGGAMTASGQNNPSMGRIGEKVSMAGLSLQGASFATYTIILLVFGYKV